MNLGLDGLNVRVGLGVGCARSHFPSDESELQYELPEASGSLEVELHLLIYDLPLDERWDWSCF